MQNSASNYLAIQALQKQADQLMPMLTTQFLQLGYKKVIHQRMSQQKSGFQGLSCAQHMRFGKVIIKWQLSADDNSSNNCDDFSNLKHELAVLKAINKAQLLQKNKSPILVQLLSDDTLNIKVMETNQQFTLLIMPNHLLGSLAQQLNNKHYPLLSDEQKQQFIIQSAHLIANLHQCGWLHNDLKPSNVLLDDFDINYASSSLENSRLLLTDFALAQPVNDKSGQQRSISAAGTPAYLAPERWHGQSATEQSDIYAFGIMAYEILMGNRPFNILKQSRNRAMDWATQHCQQLLPKLPMQHQPYQDIIDKALAKRVEKRYQSMNEITADLEKFRKYKSV